MKATNRKFAIALAFVGISVLNTACGNAGMPMGIGAVPGGMIGGSACLSSTTNGQVPTIGFSGNNILFNGNTVIGGQIPSFDNVSELYKPALGNGGKVQGTMMVAGAAAQGQGQLTGQGVDGSIYMNMTSFTAQNTTTPYQQTGYQTTSTSAWSAYASGAYGSAQGFLANVTGSITLSTAKYQNIMTALGMYNNYNNYNNTGYGTPMVQQPQQMCFAGLSISLGVAASLNKLYGGRVYLTQGATSGLQNSYSTSSTPIYLQW